MEHLDDDIKLFIVQHLATFHTPTEVVEKVAEEFGQRLKPQHLTVYNPNTQTGKEKLSPKLKAAFEQARKQYLTVTSDIPITKKAYRLRMLQKALDNAKGVKSIIEVLKFYEMVEGGAFDKKAQTPDPGQGKAAGLNLLRSLVQQKKDANTKDASKNGKS